MSEDIQILITGHVQQTTDADVCVQVHSVDGEDDDLGDTWFPKSQIEGSDPDGMEIGDDVEFYIPEGLADEKELI